MFVIKFIQGFFGWLFLNKFYVPKLILKSSRLNYVCELKNKIRQEIISSN